MSYSVFEAGGCSDHLRCKFKLGVDLPRPRGPFKFSNVIITLPEFLPTIQDYWDTTSELYHSTSAMFRFSKKLKALKPVLKSLSRKRLNQISSRVEDAYTSLCEKQTSTLEDPSPEAIAEENQAYIHWDTLADLEEGFLKQKSKLHWLQVGDKNNKYFHKSALVRAAANTMREIQCADGRVCTSQEEIKEEATNFFESLLTDQPEGLEGTSVLDLQALINFKSSIADQVKLKREVTETEIQKVLFSMPRNKALGPDGFTIEFFQATWSILGKDFVVAIQSFFLKGFLPK